MVDVDRARAGHLYVDVVIVAFAAMAGRNHGVGIEIDPAEKRRLSLFAGVNEPALLMLTKAGLGAVPPDPNVFAARLQHFDVVRRAPERIVLESFSFRIGPPENEPDIKTATGRSLEDVQCGAAAVGHCEGRPHEGDGRPDAVSRSVDGLTNAPKCRLAVDQRAHDIPRTDGIGCVANKRNGWAVRFHLGSRWQLPLSVRFTPSGYARNPDSALSTASGCSSCGKWPARAIISTRAPGIFFANSRA